jgi:hypothetical protein
VTHPGEAHAGGMSGRLNWLRAGVLGANDGIVSTAGQRDTERALLAKERSELDTFPSRNSMS